MVVKNLLLFFALQVLLRMPIDLVITCINYYMQGGGAAVQLSGYSIPSV